MKIANALSIVLGLVLFLIAAQWIFMPATAAETLSMPFLEGDARNTCLLYTSPSPRDRG